MTVFLGKNAPALTFRFSETEMSEIGSQVLATSNAIAAFANGTYVAFSLLALIAVWKGLYQRVT